MTTSTLGVLCASHRDVQQTRLALAQRGLIPAADALHKVELQLARRVTTELREHELWPWLSQFPGVRGVHAARLIAIIGNPHRFPGQGCTEGHAFAPDFAVDDQCPLLLGRTAERCPGRIVARSGTGVRSLWHYLGLHVVAGRSPRKARGQQADWNMAGRAAVLQPGGIAEQIVRANVEPWVALYRSTKARLTDTRAVTIIGSERRDGSGLAAIDGETEDNPGETRAEVGGEIARSLGPGLRPFQVDAIARKVAAKAFVADLLTAWKSLRAATWSEADTSSGAEALS